MNTFTIGQLVTLKVKGITNTRLYTVTGRVISIHGPVTKVRFAQPWCRQHNCMREGAFKTDDLKPFTPRKPENYKWL